MKYILLAFSFLSSIYSFAQQALSWSLIAPGVWRATAGKPDEFNFYSVTGVHPVLSALKAMPAVNFPLPADEINASVTDGKTYLHFPLDSAERIFGLGLNFKTVDQRGRILRLHVDHYGGQDNGRNHAPVP